METEITTNLKKGDKVFFLSERAKATIVKKGYDYVIEHKSYEVREGVVDSIIARSDDGVIKYYINEKGFLSVYLYDPNDNLFFNSIEAAKDECFRRNRIYVTVLEREAEDSKII